MKLRRDREPLDRDPTVYNRGAFGRSERPNRSRPLISHPTVRIDSSYTAVLSAQYALKFLGPHVSLSRASLLCRISVQGGPRVSDTSVL